MKSVLFVALLLGPGSLAFAEEGMKEGGATSLDPVVETTKTAAPSPEALFDRVRSAHGRAVQRGVINAPKS